MAEAKEKKGGLAALVLGSPKEEDAGAVTKDAAIAELLAALKADDADAAKEALSSFVDACLG